MPEIWDRKTPPPLAFELTIAMEAFRAAAYRDDNGTWTVGYGTTLMPSGAPVRAGDTLQEPAARILLARQMGQWLAAITRRVSAVLTANQAAALLSWVHNLGETNLAGSTMCSMINAGRMDLAADQLPGWVMSGGRADLGLMRRRELERRIWNGAGMEQYAPIWRLAAPAFSTAYAKAFADANAWAHRLVPAPAKPAARATPAAPFAQPTADDLMRLFNPSVP